MGIFFVRITWSWYINQRGCNNAQWKNSQWNKAHFKMKCFFFKWNFFFGVVACICILYLIFSNIPLKRLYIYGRHCELHNTIAWWKNQRGEVQVIGSDPIRFGSIPFRCDSIGSLCFVWRRLSLFRLTEIIGGVSSLLWLTVPANCCCSCAFPLAFKYWFMAASVIQIYG